jgi:putative CocE/NonD family hydrolase
MEAKEGSKPIHTIKTEKNVYVKMRDGVKVAVDVRRPDAKGKFPALLSMCPYSKDVQALPLPKGLGFTSEIAHIEAGDSEFWVSRGYAHIIADHRGTGLSGGEFRTWFAKEQQEDGYDLVEWIAKQPWCNGNVGMLGISWFAIIQYLVAAQRPPHLKAINPHDGWTDLYRDTVYHGGIFSPTWTRTLRNNIYDNNAKPASQKMYSKDKLKRLVEKMKSTEPFNKSPYLYGTLIAPAHDPGTFDFMLHPFDGPFYWERSAHTKLKRIKVPTYLGSEMQHYPVAMHLPGAFNAWEGIKAPKKLVIRPKVPERPFHEYHEDILRWYDYWLKGIDTGIMNEPPISIWVTEANEWRHFDEWPPKNARWMKYYLRANNLLAEAGPASDESSDSFDYEPLFPVVTNIYPMNPPPKYLEYTTEALTKDIEIVGPIALYLYASISSDDANWIVKLKDVRPDGSEFVVSRGWLKASHRELDKDKSKPWQPYHPHRRSVPVVPGEINEYAIDIRPIAYLFKAGHKIKLEVWGCDYPMQKDGLDMTLAWPVWSHLPNPKETVHTIHHTSKHASHILLPFSSKG